MRFPDIRIVCKPVHDMRVCTLGDWEQLQYAASGQTYFRITLAHMSDWRMVFCVLMHELTEWAICQVDGVETAKCDAWDFAWEQRIRSGDVPVEAEAGDDPNCPYHRGHAWGCRMERLCAFILGLGWRAYLEECDTLLRAYAERHV